METSSTSNVVNWAEVFRSNKTDVVEFAKGNLTLRDFKRRCSGDARKAVLTLEKSRKTAEARRLARRACQRRTVVLG